MLFKNQITGEEVNVSNLSKGCGQRFLIKANGVLVDTASSKQELREKATAFEKTLQGKRYKKEYCKYDETDGFYFGYDFTLFDVQPKNVPKAEVIEEPAKVAQVDTFGDMI